MQWAPHLVGMVSFSKERDTGRMPGGLGAEIQHWEVPSVVGKLSETGKKEWKERSMTSKSLRQFLLCSLFYCHCMVMAVLRNTSSQEHWVSYYFSSNKLQLAGS